MKIPSDMTVSGQVTFSHTYKCTTCGRMKMGTPRHCDLSELNNQRMSGLGMPVGWSSHYVPEGDSFYCERCK